MFNSMNKCSYIKQLIKKLYAKLMVVFSAPFFKNNLQKDSCEQQNSSRCSFFTSS